MKKKIVKTKNGYKYKTDWREVSTIVLTVAFIILLFFLSTIL